MRTLQSQIKKYEQEINHFEYVKADWQMEKEALEEVLMKLREELREKETSLTLVQAQKVRCLHTDIFSLLGSSFFLTPPMLRLRY